MDRKRCVVICAVTLAAGLFALVAWPLSTPVGPAFTLCLSGVAAVGPAEVGRAWSFAPATLVPLILVALGYALGIRIRLDQGHRNAWREAGFFAAGWALLVAALVSPLCRMAADLAWAHMVQHVILVALAPPLLLMGSAGAALYAVLSSAPKPLVPAPTIVLGRNPIVLAGLYGATIWLWHIPAFYEAALTSVPVHLLMYASLLAVALLFWNNVLATRDDGFGHAGLTVLVLLGTLVHTGMLGALLTFSRELWFPLMGRGSGAWGMTPIEDQQVAGMIMWIPMGFIYLIAALAVVASWLTRIGHHRASIGGS